MVDEAFPCTSAEDGRGVPGRCPRLELHAVARTEDETPSLHPTHATPMNAVSFGPMVQPASRTAQQATGNGHHILTKSHENGPTGESVELDISRHVSQWSADSASPEQTDPHHQGREVIEYHEGINSATILGDTFGSKPQGFVRITIRNPETRFQWDSFELDDSDAQYLQRKGAFITPARSVCDKFIRLYFERIHPYAPILDRAQFLRGYRNGTGSTFLMHAIMANVVPYAPIGLLSEAGFSDRLMAQMSLCTKAQLLHDFGVEKSQLNILQGCFLLSSLFFSPLAHRDYRYWFMNTVRLATQIGIDRYCTATHLDLSTRQSFQRIWSVLYIRDVQLTLSGLSNVRRIIDENWKPADITEADDGDTEELAAFGHLVPPLTKLQKVYFTQAGMLANLGARFLQIFKTHGRTPAKEACQEFEKSLSSWRKALPTEMHTENVQEWSAANVWALVLRATSYRLECGFYRLLTGYDRTTGDQAVQHASLKQQNAIFELDTVIERIMLHGLIKYCPLSVFMCASTTLAMHVETALKTFANSHQRLAAQARIHTSLLFLAAGGESWPHARRMLKVFEVILARTNLSLDGAEKANAVPKPTHPFRQADNEKQAEVSGSSNNANDPNSGANPGPSDQDRGPDPRPRHPRGGTNSFAVDSLLPEYEPLFGQAADAQPEEWLQDFLELNYVGI
ncbi:uncharacterized protein A1O5_10443 [Cladophialophora psammophila CBS 110553]|uniref:Xylanolytic transcriptional activator regulatory domain-containing protein n=1 Tax=Cladophialophora psammophila CBS 110553 TaxID=1182543 RepID=W9WNQ1_9EURO|nr:uncharacterized protein A1O5_10443 [Cladophialophora psammophila CBS 110553]EXJ66291.1 hypothetical protein A1O5_10443 [Cladophialophora psammophila CBS 110553]